MPEETEQKETTTIEALVDDANEIKKYTKIGSGMREALHAVIASMKLQRRYIDEIGKGPAFEKWLAKQRD